MKKYPILPIYPSKKKKLKNLKIELEEAVTREDYEKAAQLRDEIKKMEISNLN